MHSSLGAYSLFEMATVVKSGPARCNTQAQYSGETNGKGFCSTSSASTTVPWWPHRRSIGPSPRQPDAAYPAGAQHRQRQHAGEILGLNAAVDMLDSTPVIALKPYLSSIPEERLQRGWLAEAEARRKPRPARLNRGGFGYTSEGFDHSQVVRGYFLTWSRRWRWQDTPGAPPGLPEGVRRIPFGLSAG